MNWNDLHLRLRALASPDRVEGELAKERQDAVHAAAAHRIRGGACAGTAGLYRSRRGPAARSLAPAARRADSRSQGLRLCLRLGGVPGCCRPLPFRATGGGVGRRAARARRERADHALRPPFERTAGGGTDSIQPRRACHLLAAHRGRALPLWRGPQPAGGGDGQALALAADAPAQPSVHSRFSITPSAAAIRCWAST